MDLNKLIEGLTKSGVTTGLVSGLAGGAISGALMGKGGGKIAKNLLGAGALAAVGGVAWMAYQNYRKSGSVTALPPATPTRNYERLTEPDFAAVVDRGGANGALLIVHAMVRAALADGHIDEGERARVFTRASQLDLSAAERAEFFDILDKPLTQRELITSTPDAETAIEVYTASVLAVDQSRTEGRTYLQGLAFGLQLPADLVAAIHERAAATGAPA